MTLRTSRLFFPCIKCSKMYLRTTKRPGVCNNCKPESFLDEMVKKQKKMDLETIKHQKVIQEQKISSKPSLTHRKSKIIKKVGKS